MQSSDRRTFLLTSSLAAAHAAFAQDQPVNAGMIGTGNRGSYVMKGVMEQPGVKVAAVCDIKPDRLDKAATAAGRDNPKTYTDYRKLLEQKDINAVFVATPPDLHVEMAIAAIQAGKHVYCEKPVGITPESIRELVKVVRNSKQVFQAGQQMRSISRLRKTIEKIEQGAIGKILMVKAQRHSSTDLSHTGPSADWFFDAKRSGEYLVEMSVHNLDACNWVIGARPERAAGFGGTMLYKNDPPGRTIMDGYTLSYEYPNDVRLSFTQLVFHPRGLPGGNQYIYVYGSTGAVDLMTSNLHPRDGSASSVLVPEEKENPHAHVAAFFESIRTGKKPVAGIEVGAQGALTAILGRDAIYKKKVLTWKDLGVEI